MAYPELRYYFYDRTSLNGYLLLPVFELANLINRKSEFSNNLVFELQNSNIDKLFTWNKQKFIFFS